MSFHVVIPARYASSRLPGKPLVNIAGKPMVQWVYEQAQKSGADSVVVATDDVRVFDAVAEFGGEAMMTSPAHASGTDRLAEVAAELALAEDAVLVNVQGDEPLIAPRAIAQVAGNLTRETTASVATLCEPFSRYEDVVNPNFVKVVRDTHDFALYFSRAPIPWDRERFAGPLPSLDPSLGFFRHVGLYSYRVGLLQRFINWPQSGLEKAERLEQLRVLENGHRIHVALACESLHAGVDTPEDLVRIQQQFEQMKGQL